MQISVGWAQILCVSVGKRVDINGNVHIVLFYVVYVLFCGIKMQMICELTLVQLQTNNKHINMNKLNYFLVPVLKSPLD